MVQYSVYARVCNGSDAVDAHRYRLKGHLPSNGSIRMIVVTEKQYNAIDILVGQPSVYDKPQENEQLMLF